MERRGFGFSWITLLGSGVALGLAVLAYFRAQPHWMASWFERWERTNLPEAGKKMSHKVGELVGRRHDYPIGRKLGELVGRQHDYPTSRKFDEMMERKANEMLKRMEHRLEDKLGHQWRTMTKESHESLPTQLWRPIEGTFGGVTQAPSWIGGAVTAFLGAVVGTVMYLVVAGLTLSLIGAFMVYVFAPEPQQRRELWQQVQNRYHHLYRYYQRLTRQVQHLTPEARTRPGERRAA